jgi:hypothetical protein
MPKPRFLDLSGLARGERRKALESAKAALVAYGLAVNAADSDGVVKAVSNMAALDLSECPDAEMIERINSAPRNLPRTLLGICDKHRSRRNVKGVLAAYNALETLARSYRAEKRAVWWESRLDWVPAFVAKG